MKLLLLATVALGLILVDGYSNREFTDPKDLAFACSKLYPNHALIEPKTGGPYSLTVTDVGNSKRVTISGAALIHGFILQAKGAQGSFSSPSDDIYTLSCSQGPTIRHARLFNNTEFAVTWTPSGPGRVAFNGAAVETWTEFYKLSA